MMFFNMLKFFCYFLILAIVSEQSQSAANREPVCGEFLTEVLETLCNGGFHTKMKKSMDLTEYAYNEIEDDLPFPYANSPFLAKIHAGTVNLLAKTRRRRQGIVDECCHKSCTFSELNSYCV